MNTMKAQKGDKKRSRKEEKTNVKPTTTWVQIPDEIVHDILLRLPAMSLT